MFMLKKQIPQLSFFCLILATFFLFSSLVNAKNMQKLDNINVHYIALNSTFLTPEIATAYGITRSKVNALINISVLDNTKSGMPAKSVNLQGTAKNLLGHEKTLEFVEVKEGDAIYYLAELSFTNEDIITFNVQINDAGKIQTLKFQQKLYTE